MKKLLCIFFLLFSKQLFSQQTFQRTIGGTGYECGNNAQITSDGGFIIAGYASSYGAGGYDVYLIKTNANGDTLWTKTFGGNAHDNAFSVKQTFDGGYIICGYTETFGPGAYAVYLIKTDAGGNMMWSKTYGGLVDEAGASVLQVTDGYILVGSTTSYGTGSSAVYLIKTDTNGNILWTKTFSGLAFQTGNAIEQTTDNGFIILGYTSSFGAGDDDLYLIKTDSSGSLSWSKTFGGVDKDWGHDVHQTSDGGYILTGVTWSFGVGDMDVYLLKTDINGNLLWSKTYGGLTDDWGSYVQQTSDNEYIITGYTTSFGAGNPDVYLIKTDSIGNALWSKTFGGTGSDYGHTVFQTADNGYFIAGFTGSFLVGLSDVYLIKTDSEGNSDCNEMNAVTMITSPATQVSSPNTLVSSGGYSTNPATLTSSGGGIVTLCFSTSVKEVEENNSFNIYPNPFTKETILRSSNHFTNATLIIYDTFGQEIKTIKNLSGQSITLYKDNLQSGVYYIRLSEATKTIATKKLVVL